MSRPAVPLRQFVHKVHSRCHLACDYCYVYQAADQGWRGRPMVMSDETIACPRDAGGDAVEVKKHLKISLLDTDAVEFDAADLGAGPAEPADSSATSSPVEPVCSRSLRSSAASQRRRTVGLPWSGTHPARLGSSCLF
jgi:hypothetical protein